MLAKWLGWFSYGCARRFWSSSEGTFVHITCRAFWSLLGRDSDPLPKAQGAQGDGCTAQLISRVTQPGWQWGARAEPEQSCAWDLLIFPSRASPCSTRGVNAARRPCLLPACRALSHHAHLSRCVTAEPPHACQMCPCPPLLPRCPPWGTVAEGTPCVTPPTPGSSEMSWKIGPRKKEIRTAWGFGGVYFAVLFFPGVD